MTPATHAGRRLVRPHARARRALLSLTACAACVACGERRSTPERGDAATPADTSSPGTERTEWQVRPLTVAPPRFRPGGWSDEHVLWGQVRSRVTRLDTRTGEQRTLNATGWWLQAAPGVVTWQNETGTWLLRDGGSPVRLAGPAGDPERRGDGPTVLLSRDATRMLLGWQHEWDTFYDLVERDGSRRRLETRIPGYYLNGAVLWLDSTRVLFHTVAMGPVGGEPTYRESGWRGALAVLDLHTNQYALAASVPDFTYLRVAGPHRGDDVLVTEWDTSANVRGHWLYDTRTWRRRPAPLPKGRAFASRAGAVAVLLDPQADSTQAVLVADGETTSIGRVARDGEPVFSPSGRRGALRTAAGVVVFEAVP